MRDKHGFAPLGPATGAVKSAIFGYNSARLCKRDLRADLTGDWQRQICCRAVRVAARGDAEQCRLRLGRAPRLKGQKQVFFLGGRVVVR
jgi:hypothetical protein